MEVDVLGKGKGKKGKSWNRGGKGADLSKGVKGKNKDNSGKKGVSVDLLDLRQGWAYQRQMLEQSRCCG